MSGIWVEPEMVNVDSDLYRAHPDWAIAIPEKAHSEGRWQRLLDFSNPEVVDHMTEAMTEVLSSARINYVKWDYNRIFSDVYSPYLKEKSSGELFHRYILGLYRLMGALVNKFPNILFEGCAAGGNRFDLGILSYFPQIWASDNSDAISRLTIQQGLSFGYPLSAVTGHVSACPNHQTLRKTPINTRFNVAAFTSYGMEVNPLDVQGLYDKALDFVSAHKDEHINLYVTGLTVALVSIIKACMELHVSLTLYHYDRDSNSYYPQEVI